MMQHDACNDMMRGVENRCVDVLIRQDNNKIV